MRESGVGRGTGDAGAAKKGIYQINASLHAPNAVEARPLTVDVAPVASLLSLTLGSTGQCPLLEALALSPAASVVAVPPAPLCPPPLVLLLPAHWLYQYQAVPARARVAPAVPRTVRALVRDLRGVPVLAPAPLPDIWNALRRLLCRFLSLCSR